MRSPSLDDDADFLEALREAEEDVALVGEEIRNEGRRSEHKRENRNKERRRVKREELEAKGVRFITCADGKTRPACNGMNSYGEPCGAIPIKKGKVLTVKGSDETCTATGGYCLRCDDAVTASFMTAWSAQARGGRKRRVGPDQYIREIVEQAVGIFIRPHLDAMGIKVNPDTGKPEYVDGEGAKIYGESKDGDIYMTNHDDVEAQQKAAERLFDRGFGKPRIQAEISLAPSGGIQKIPPTAERALEVAAVLSESGAVGADEDETTEETE